MRDGGSLTPVRSHSHGGGLGFESTRAYQPLQSLVGSLDVSSILVGDALCARYLVAHGPRALAFLANVSSDHHDCLFDL
jgi:hypothetical protein